MGYLNNINIKIFNRFMTLKYHLSTSTLDVHSVENKITTSVENIFSNL